MPIAVALGLRAGAAGSHFQATKRHGDSTTAGHQGRVIPLISQRRTSREFGSALDGARLPWVADAGFVGTSRGLPGKVDSAYANLVRSPARWF